LCVELYNDDDTPIDLAGYSGEMAIARHYNGGSLVNALVTIELPNKITAQLTADQTKELPETTLYGTLQVKNDEGTILIEQFQFFVYPNTNL
jgi:hypothetical protein